MNLKGAISLAAIVGFFILALLYIYSPVVPQTVLGWILLLVLGVPVWFFLEWFGELISQSKFLAQRSRTVRILIAIPLVIISIVIGGFLIRLVQIAILSV